MTDPHQSDDPPRPPARRPTFDEVLGSDGDDDGDEPREPGEPGDMDSADVANGEPGAQDNDRRQP